MTTDLPQCDKGIGDVILAPDSPKLIAGVLCARFDLWPDDRGYFLEVQRIGRGLAAHFPPETTQISAAMNYPGIIKAFHIHKHQTDCWTPAAGLLQVVLIDLRPDSSTFGVAQHGLRWRSSAPADSDSARRGARLQVMRHRAVSAGVCNGSVLQSRRRRPYSSQRSTPELRLGTAA